MARKRCKPEEFVGLLRQSEVLHGQGKSMSGAIRQLGISEVTYFRRCKEHSGMSGDQVRRLKELEKENERLRRGESDLTLDKQILAEAACGNVFSIRGVRINAPFRTSSTSAIPLKGVPCRVDSSEKGGCPRTGTEGRPAIPLQQLDRPRRPPSRASRRVRRASVRFPTGGWWANAACN